ncbi:MAG: hypothetical protein JZU65_20510 [Chlorobium sp.]|nr:hypothetical protein [Chlorobium sp.]
MEKKILNKLCKFLALTGTLAVFIAGNSYAGEMMQAEFQTMDDCLAKIKKSSGQALEIVTDKPNNVSGFLANRKGFGCKKKESGTKGTYFEGWYEL